MRPIAIVIAFVALWQGALADDQTTVFVDKTGQITRAAPSVVSKDLRYSFGVVQCPTVGCPSLYVVQGIPRPQDISFVHWMNEVRPEIVASENIIAAIDDVPDGSPFCWLLRGDLVGADEGMTLRVDELVGSCS